ncbi:NADH:flavin oxidoreductase [Candidatus Sumerlaeota bacterium]|nr:NADH:flavin oxidoreductase [Candidatus Sumerlaeota bacterium]
MTTEILEQKSASVEPLFRPAQFGAATLRNKIVMAPMTRSKSPGKVPNDAVLRYYRRHAEGGLGMIITEGVNPMHIASSGYPAVPYFDGEAACAQWKRICDSVHEAGCAIIPQIWHVGSIRKLGMEPDPAIPGYGPSPIAHPFYAGKGEIPHEMTQKDIDETIASFASAARNAKMLGFDGVELHGAHGYIIDQFFWEVTNQRTDAYGGSLEKRTRFAAEIIAAVRAAVGPEYPICLRYSQWKLGAYDVKLAKTPQELERFLTPLAAAGLDWFHASNRRFNEPEFEGSNLNLAGWTKKITGLPAITVGSVGLDSDFLRSYAGKPSGKASIDALVTRLENNEFDLVAVGRALLADPDWPKKIQEGREAEIVTFEPKHMMEFPY